MPGHELASAYDYCLKMARDHYENFPVASRLLPRRLRRPIAVIYAFARSADDIADEGDADEKTRLEQLAAYAQMLDGLQKGEIPADPVFIALADVIQRHALPLDLFYDLLSAFRMDVTTREYETFAALMHYCRHSANPIGRLLLHLYKVVTPRNLGYSDAICSSLQLINFYQDLTQDYQENRRIYLPQEEMRRFQVSETHIREQRGDPAMHGLMRFQYQRARKMLEAGAPLVKNLRGRFGFELRLTILGASRVLLKLEQSSDPFARPRLTFGDWLWLLLRSLASYVIRIKSP